MTFPVRVVPQPELVKCEALARGRFMTRHERELDAVVDAAPAGKLVIAYQDADGEFTAVTITNVRI